MKRLLMMMTACLLVLAATAQYRNRPHMTEPEEEARTKVREAWSREIYREVDLRSPRNRVLYATTPEGLFGRMITLGAKGIVDVYPYTIDGEDATQGNPVEMKAVLDNFHITYTEDHGRLTVDEKDIPYTSVTGYYFKEKIYYDMTNSSYHTDLVAICPIITAADEYDGSSTIKYPMFWVRYNDLRPWLENCMVRNRSNDAIIMSVDEYLAMGLYKGSIYKTTEIIDGMLTGDAITEKALKEIREQAEQELDKVRKVTYNTYQK